MMGIQMIVLFLTQEILEEILEINNKESDTYQSHVLSFGSLVQALVLNKI